MKYVADLAEEKDILPPIFDYEGNKVKLKSNFANVSSFARIIRKTSDQYLIVA